MSAASVAEQGPRAPASARSRKRYVVRAYDQSGHHMLTRYADTDEERDQAERYFRSMGFDVIWNEYEVAL